MTSPTPPGWYPDPYGSPGLLRWWDGSQWTDHAHGAPTDAGASGAPGGGPGPGGASSMYPSGPQGGTGPGGPSQAGPSWGGTGQPWGADTGAPAGPSYPYSGPAAAPSGRGRAMPWLFGGIGALVVILVAVSLLVVTGVIGGSGGGGGGGGGTPAATDTSPSPLSSPTDSGTAATDRVTDSGSGLSYDRPTSHWSYLQRPRAVSGMVTWTEAIGTVAQSDYEGDHDWIANVFTGVGEASYSGKGSLPRVTRAMARYLEANNYSNVGKKTLQVLDSKSVEVDGHAAWLEKFKYTYNEADKRNLRFKTETAAVLGIDRPGKKPALMYVSVPDNFDAGIVDRTLRSIKVES